MLPYTVKSLTNSRKLIYICSKLGYGVSRSILEELATENAFLVIDQQHENLVMLIEVAEDRLTIAAYDNVYQLEEILTV